MTARNRYRSAFAAAFALVASLVVWQAPHADAATAAGDKQSFVVYCGFSHNRPDDPLVYPSTPGASHLHAFAGNTSTDAYSTTDSLRASGTTCGVTADRSAYWVPALYDDGRQVDPRQMRVYYTAGGKDHRRVQAPPEGLGYLVKDQAQVRWLCQGGGSAGPMQLAPPTCPSGQHLTLVIRFPDCWDGANLDSKDHMSHVVFNRRGVCPSTHPVPIAQLRLNVQYHGSDGGSISLAPAANPSAPHADWINAWDLGSLERLVRRCINAGLECQREETIRLS